MPRKNMFLETYSTRYENYVAFFKCALLGADAGGAPWQPAKHAAELFLATFASKSDTTRTMSLSVLH